MNRADAIAAATRAVLAPQLKDLRDGRGTSRASAEGKEVLSPEAWFAEQARRRKGEIAAEAARLMNERAALCHCGAVATTVVAGQHYCDAHAAAAPRLATPGVAAA